MRQQSRRYFLLSILAAAAFMVTGAQAGPPRYRLTDLGALLPGDDFIEAVDINNRGEVVGTSCGLRSRVACRVFLWRNGVMKDIGKLYPDTKAMHASAINERSQIVGIALPTSGSETAFVYSKGRVTELKTGKDTTYATDINDWGHITGEACCGVEGGWDAFVYRAGQFKFFAAAASPVGINNRGQVVGLMLNDGVFPYHAFLYDKGRLIDLHDASPIAGDPTGESWATSINDSGQVTGHFGIPGQPSHAFLYANGVMKDLGPIGRLGYANDINEAGQVVGKSTVLFASGERSRAFIYTSGKMYDLNYLTSNRRGFELLWGNAINDAGQIVGVGHIWGRWWERQRGFLLTPIPKSAATR